MVWFEIIRWHFHIMAEEKLENVSGQSVVWLSSELGTP
jgi:hypothetical protein